MSKHWKLRTRWIFFLCATIFNLALVYGFMSERLQLPALLFLGVISAVTGAYFLRSQRRAKEDFRQYLRDARVGGWGEAAVFDKDLKDKVGEIETVSLAVWRREGHSVWVQRRRPKNRLGKVENVLAATLSRGLPGKMLVYRRLGKDDLKRLVGVGRGAAAPDPSRGFATRSDPPEFASRFLDVETWQAVCAVAALEDPLHQFYLSGNGLNVTVSLEGELDDVETARCFVEKAFQIIDRAITLAPQP